jgi:hypothetical protein
LVRDAIGGGVDEPGHFLGAEHDGHLPPQQFGKGKVVAGEAAFQKLR